VTLPATTWAVMTLYNTKDGLPNRKVTGQTIGFYCPFWFDEKKGTWTLKPNSQDYTKKIAGEISNPPNAMEE
jgi:hypothetical protein